MPVGAARRAGVWVCLLPPPGQTQHPPTGAAARWASLRALACGRGVLCECCQPERGARGPAPELLEAAGGCPAQPGLHHACLYCPGLPGAQWQPLRLRLPAAYSGPQEAPLDQVGAWLKLLRHCSRLLRAQHQQIREAAAGRLWLASRLLLWWTQRQEQDQLRKQGGCQRRSLQEGALGGQPVCLLLLALRVLVEGCKPPELGLPQADGPSCAGEGHDAAAMQGHCSQTLWAVLEYRLLPTCPHPWHYTCVCVCQLPLGRF